MEVIDFPSFLGRTLDSASVRSLLAVVGGDVETENDDGETFMAIPSAGLELLFGSTGRLESIFLFAGGEESCRQFAGELPEGLSFTSSRFEVRAHLGDPDECAEEQVFLGQEIAPWDKFLRRDWYLHVRYSANLGSVRRVTVSAVPDAISPTKPVA